MQRDAKGRFRPGSGGRPAGSRNRASATAEALAEQGPAVARKMAELALAGDPQAGAACLRYLLPRPRHAPLDLPLPTLTNATSACVALSTLTEAVAAGRIAPDAGHAVAGLIGRWLEAFAIADLEARIRRLEEADAPD